MIDCQRRRQQSKDNVVEFVESPKAKGMSNHSTVMQVEKGNAPVYQSSEEKPGGQAPLMGVSYVKI